MPVLQPEVESTPEEGSLRAHDAAALTAVCSDGALMAADSFSWMDDFSERDTGGHDRRHGGRLSWDGHHSPLVVSRRP
jgi:hypothetical protein